MSHRAVYVAGLALALSIYAVVRGPRGAETGVDLEAREQIGALRRELAQRDAVIQRLTRAPAAPEPAAPSTADRGGSAGSADAPPPTPSEPSPEPGRRRFVRFETANPAVHVTQKADGGYDIQNTDPALAGTVLQVTAVAASGEETKVLIRIPQ